MLARDVIAQRRCAAVFARRHGRLRRTRRDTQGASRQPRTLLKVGTLYTGEVSAVSVGEASASKFRPARRCLTGPTRS